MKKIRCCPVCGERPKIGYACGEYYVYGSDDNCPGCGVTAFTEMHSSEEFEIRAWNRFVDNWEDCE